MSKPRYLFHPPQEDGVFYCWWFDGDETAAGVAIIQGEEVFFIPSLRTETGEWGVLSDYHDHIWKKVRLSLKLFFKGPPDLPFGFCSRCANPSVVCRC